MKQGTSAQEIADFLLLLAAKEDPEEPVFLTNLQLQKLLYLAQGWALAQRDQPLFAERLEAWPHGPAVYTVWKRFERFGKKPITDEPPVEPALAPEDRELVRAVWETYKKFSPPALRDMTHEDAPWQRARRGLQQFDSSHKPLSSDEMKACFRAKLAGAQDRLRARRALLGSRAAKNLERFKGQTPA